MKNFEKKFFSTGSAKTEILGKRLSSRITGAGIPMQRKKFFGLLQRNFRSQSFVPGGTFLIHLESYEKETIRGANWLKFGISISFWKKSRKSKLKWAKMLIEMPN